MRSFSRFAFSARAVVVAATPIPGESKEPDIELNAQEFESKHSKEVKLKEVCYLELFADVENFKEEFDNTIVIQDEYGKDVFVNDGFRKDESNKEFYPKEFCYRDFHLKEHTETTKSAVNVQLSNAELAKLINDKQIDTNSLDAAAASKLKSTKDKEIDRNELGKDDKDKFEKDKSIDKDGKKEGYRLAKRQFDASKRTPVTTPQDWSKRLSEVNVSKDDLNNLVANYLFTEGYLSAAEHFSREAGLDPHGSSSAGGAADVETIRSRMDIRRAVLKGDVEEALEKVVDLDLEILDLDPSLHFHLLQQQLIELIRAGQIDLALSFAQNELAPLAEEHPKFLKELERTMALLAFEMPTFSLDPASAASSAGAAPPAAAAPAPAPSLSKKLSKKGKSSASAAKEPALPPMPPHIAHLLDPSQRLSTAKELNAAILIAQGHAPEPKLPGLLAAMNWGEGLLSDRGAEWPRWDLREVLGEKGRRRAGQGRKGVAWGGEEEIESEREGEAMVL
ncbi:hypothetical protein JCM10207_000292 [Rhodosporidiobolus poonsookiae]